MTIDEETLRLYAEMQAAARDGNLLSYANNLARSMASGRMPVVTREESIVRPAVPIRAPVEREDTQRHGEAASEIRSNPASVRPAIPQPESIRRQISGPEMTARTERPVNGDRVKVSRL